MAGLPIYWETKLVQNSIHTAKSSQWMVICILAQRNSPNKWQKHWPPCCGFASSKGLLRPAETSDCVPIVSSRLCKKPPLPMRTEPRSVCASLRGSVLVGKGLSSGLRYFPEADIHFLDQLTGDGRKLELKYNGSCSLETFYNEPKHPNGNSYRLQAWMYSSRFLQYVEALSHLLRTGQGVVLERSPYSDFVFLEAMSKQGYIHPRCVKHYYRMKHLSICEILPPHLVFYIDIPVSEVKKRIEEVGEPYEKKVSAAYLQSIEDVYKKSFLPHISETSEVLQYTASEADCLERIIEDIEMLKFNKGPWLEQDDITLHYLRCCVEDKSKLMSTVAVPDYIPEITIGGLDADSIYHSYRALPGRMFASGYNADVGDKWIWLK